MDMPLCCAFLEAGFAWASLNSVGEIWAQGPSRPGCLRPSLGRRRQSTVAPSESLAGQVRGALTSSVAQEEELPSLQPGARNHVRTAF